jgi:hypothetical protein
MSQETITVYIRQSQNFTGLGNHMWAVYTNSAGQSYSLSGWATHEGSVLAPWGSLDAQVTKWGPTSWDWGGNNNYSASQLIASGADLSGSWNSMVQCAAKIDAANLAYGPLGVNSNALINTCLLWANLPQVTIDSELPGSSLWTPGGSWDLRDFDLNMKYLPDEPGAPSVNLGFYKAGYGFGSGGERFSGYGGFGSWGGTTIFGGTSGHWVKVSVQVGDAPPSVGWRWVEAVATRIKPVVLDLDGDGVELTASTLSPGFDFFATGHVKTTGWFAGGDAMLVFDGNLNGQVDDGTEISFLHHSPASSTDLEALAAFDSNANGLLDPGDRQYGYFRLWRDLDFDGISDPGELQTLASANVASIGLQGSGGGYQVAGNDIHGVSTFWRSDGSTGSAYDVAFEAHSRGSKLISQNLTWAVVEMDTGERLAVLQPGAAAVTIANAANTSVNGVSVVGFQLGGNNDSITTGYYGNKALYVDGGAGDDTINLSSSSYGSVIKGGAGDDMIYGTTGNDYIAPGTSVYYNDQVTDYGGDDYYVIDDNSYAHILDSGGTDIVVLSNHTSAQLFAFRYTGFGSDSLVVGTIDSLVSIEFKNMYTSSSYGVEYLVLQDKTMTREELFLLAGGSTYSSPVESEMDRAYAPYSGSNPIGPEVLFSNEYYG